MRSLLLHVAASAFCALQGTARSSPAFQQSLWFPSLENSFYDEGEVGYEERRQTARFHKTELRRAGAYLGFVLLAVTATYLILQCFLSLKYKRVVFATGRSLAEGGYSCPVSDSEVPRTHIARSSQKNCYCSLGQTLHLALRFGMRKQYCGLVAYSLPPE